MNDTMTITGKLVEYKEFEVEPLLVVRLLRNKYKNLIGVVSRMDFLKNGNWIRYESESDCGTIKRKATPEETKMLDAFDLIEEVMKRLGND